MKEYINKKIEEFEKEFPKTIEIVIDVGGDSDTLDLRERFKDLLISAIQGQLELLSKELEKRYGDGNEEALVIVKPIMSGGVEQRPALSDIQSLLK